MEDISSKEETLHEKNREAIKAESETEGRLEKFLVKERRKKSVKGKVKDTNKEGGKKG